QLLDLGEPAFLYLTETVHRRPRSGSATWIGSTRSCSATAPRSYAEPWRRGSTSRSSVPLTWSASCSARSSSRRRSNEHESLHAYAKSFFDPQRGEPMTTMNDNHLSKSLSARASVKSKGRKKEGVSEPLPPSPGQQGGTPTVVSNPETKTA